MSTNGKTAKVNSDPISSRDNLVASFPACLILSPSLQTLDLSRNSISCIAWDNPVRPNQEVLQSRKDVSFFDSFPSTPTKSDFRDDDTDEVMPSLRTLSLSNNKITNLGLRQAWPRNIEVIDLSENRLQGVLDITALALLPRLKRLILSGNGLTGVLVQAQEEAVLWPSLELVDLKKNEIRAEESLVDSLRLNRPYTTSSGTDSRGIVQIVSRMRNNNSINSDARTVVGSGGKPDTIHYDKETASRHDRSVFSSCASGKNCFQ